MENFYQVLGVERSASEADIKKAYRKLAKLHHPDINQGDLEAEKTFKTISEAYDTLSDPQKRSEYNESLDTPHAHRHSPPTHNHQYFGTMQDFLNHFMGQDSNQNSDIFHELAVPVNELMHSFKKPFHIVRRISCTKCGGQGGKDRKTCAKCYGQGGTTVFQGPWQRTESCGVCSGRGYTYANPCGDCHDGVKFDEVEQKIECDLGCAFHLIRIPGMGNHIDLSQKAGDLVIKIIPRNTATFEVDGEYNIHTKLDLDPVEAMLGSFKQVKGVSGKEITVEVPRGCKHKQMLRLRSKGIPKGIGSSTDLYIHTMYKPPEKLSPEQEKALRDYINTLS